MQNFKDGHIPVADNKAVSLKNYALKVLANKYTGEELNYIVDWLVEHFTGYKKNELIANPTFLVNQSIIIRFSNAIDKMLQGAPVQYVIGEMEFYHLKLLVSPGVLIPRPETEELVDIIIKENIGKDHLKVLDIGTGSGCIALSLAKNLSGASITAIDVSIEALEIAKKNAIKNKITHVDFLCMDILQDKVSFNHSFDIIVSNPPYIAMAESALMSENVLNYEPHQALFVPNEDPLIFYKTIADVAPKCLKPQGKIYLEINERLGNDTANLFRNNHFNQVHLLNDLFGKNRFIKIEKI